MRRAERRRAASAPFSVLLLIVAGTGVMGALRHTINEAWDIHDRPPLLRRKALDLALVLGATIVLALSLAVTATRTRGRGARRRGGRRLARRAARRRRRRAAVRVHGRA